MRRHILAASDLLRVGITAGALLGVLLVPGAAAASGGSRQDHDGDGLRNAYERYHTHTNPWKKDSDHDGIKDGRENPDHDGLTNLQEVRVGTDPLKRDTDRDGTRDGREDADHDGLDNHHEFEAGTDPRDADTDDDDIDDGQEDSDHDGADNEDEQHDGTDPGDRDTDDDDIDDGEDADANGDGYEDACEALNGDDSPLCEDDEGPDDH